MERQTGVIIVAGGGGSRMGGARPKQFMLLGGMPILARTINNFAAALPGAEIVVVLPAEHTGFWHNLSARFEVAPHTVAEGGRERFHSVKNGLAALKRDPELIAAIRRAWKEDFGQDVSEDEVLVTTSSCIGMSQTLMGILNPGDEVIVFSPYFPMYREQIELAGGVCVDVLTYASEDYAIDEARLRAAITPRTKAIVFNNPTNPTGMGYDSRTLELLARVAQEHDLLIAADEIYTTYLYEGDFRPIRTLPGMAERTITLNSFSKNFLMTGWRVGVIIAEPELLAVMNRVNGSLIYSAPSISQRAALQALAMRKEIREKYVTAYRDRIFYAADRIEKIPYLSLVRPKGTFYLFPGVEKTGLDEKAFCKVLLDQAHVLVSPGTPFGVSAAGHFRIACTVGIDQLKTAFDRMEKLSF